MNAVEINNLSFKYNDIIVFENLNINIEKNILTTVIGQGGSGKTTLFKLLSGEYKTGNIKMFDKSIEYNKNKNSIGIISLNCSYFKKKTVVDELINIIKEKGNSLDKIKEKIERVTKKTCLESILEKKIIDLKPSEIIKLQVAYQLIIKPKIILIENAFNYLEKEKIVKEIVKMSKRCTIINITNNVEEILYGEKVLILADKTYDTIKMTEEDFIKNNLNVPFMIELSSKLRMYKLIKENYKDMEKLVDNLWQ